MPSHCRGCSPVWTTGVAQRPRSLPPWAPWYGHRPGLDGIKKWSSADTRLGRPWLGSACELVGMDDKSSVGATAQDMEFTGLYGYLSEDGASLSSARQRLWRMPTTAEVVASPGREGERAARPRQPIQCAVIPDTETPPWAPDEPRIYMWTADMPAPGEAEYVGDNGSLGSQPNDGGNRQHGVSLRASPEVRLNLHSDGVTG